MFEINYEKDESLGLWKATATLELPKITVTRWKADRSDFRYDISRAITEVVEQYVEKRVQEED